MHTHTHACTHTPLHAHAPRGHTHAHAQDHTLGVLCSQEFFTILSRHRQALQRSSPDAASAPPTAQGAHAAAGRARACVLSSGRVACGCTSSARERGMCALARLHVCECAVRVTRPREQTESVHLHEPRRASAWRGALKRSRCAARPAIALITGFTDRSPTRSARHALRAHPTRTAAAEAGEDDDRESHFSDTPVCPRLTGRRGRCGCLCA